MFGWLAAYSTPLCYRASPTVVSRRSRRISPRSLLKQLPALGNILYLHTTSAQVIAETWAPGLLVAEHAFTPLLDTRWLIATSAVTDDGPREWCECVDAFGRTQARLHLLPDTDYLAWEALMASCEPDQRALPLPATPPFRPEHADIVSFHMRELAGLWLLERGSSSTLSPLGSRVAARIASAESAVLLKE